MKNKHLQINFKFKYQMMLVFFIIGVGTIILSQGILQKVVEIRLINLAISDIKQYVIPNFKDLITLSVKLDDDIILANSARKVNYYNNINSFRITDDNDRILVSNFSEEINQIYKYNLTFFKQDKILFADESQSEVNKLFLKNNTDSIEIYYLFSFMHKQEQIKRKIFLTISKNFVNKVNEDLKRRFLLIGCGISILSVLFGFLFSEKVSRKIEIIKSAAQVIGSGNFMHRITIKAALKDELVDLSADINKMASSLKEAESMKLENERFEQELRIAEQIQQTLLPVSTPKTDNFEFGSIYYSAKEVGGDYFDWITVDDNHLGIVCADVSGKGVPGAFVMAITRSVLRSYAVNILSPGELLKKVNALLKKDMKKGMFVTMWYGILDINTGQIKFANAGHNPVIIYRNNKKDIEIMETQGSPLGILNENIFNKKLVETEIVLSEGDILIQYTDGVTEAFNSNKEMFEFERLYEVIRNSGSNISAQQMIDNINENVKKFVNEYEQSDDILMVSIKKKTKQG
ncbi:SpoIIE family protein phosphatase [Candidatus Dependentiae bacterium]|nr:SpoIIE family protein phosphatase [Candidatus Dependentiae bacterium]